MNDDETETGFYAAFDEEGVLQMVEPAPVPVDVDAALRLGLLVSADTLADEALAAAREEGRQQGRAEAIADLRGKDDAEQARFNDAICDEPAGWDGWPYAHPYRLAAEYLATHAPTTEGSTTP